MERSDKEKKHIQDKLKNICKGSETLLIGLTGGIATGKSTVANMFESLGSVIIDFDILARDVVEPDRTSWKLICDFFGEEILNSNRTINRKILSGIVFNNPAKRKKLESFTHPYIWDEFIRQTKKTVKKNRNAIIQAVIPLLIEGNMQDLFSKIIVVYSSPEVQIQRLMNRDGISKEMANKILKAQMPIDDKLPHSDFIINNEGAVSDTGKEVKEIWKKLKAIQKKTVLY